MVDRDVDQVDALVIEARAGPARREDGISSGIDVLISFGYDFGVSVCSIKASEATQLKQRQIYTHSYRYDLTS